MRQERALLRGDILFPYGTVKGSISVVNGAIEHVSLEELEGPDEGQALFEGLIAPGLVDLHTHLGDHGARGDLPVSIEEAFFPGGAKHRFLDGADRTTLVSSIRASLEEVSPGVDLIMDFREGGVCGMEALIEASRGSRIRVLGFGRPVTGPDLGPLLDISHGLGMPSLDSCGPGIREAARARGLPFALHASELYREDIGGVLDLGPELVIHMVSGTRDDWRALSDENVPVALCPRSYLAFGLPSDIRKMLDDGLALGLGTDNAMTVRQDMFREMECAWAMLHRSGLTGAEASKTVLDMSTGRSLVRTRLGCMVDGVGVWGGSKWLEKGSRASVRVLRGPKPGSKADPWSHVVRFSGQDTVVW